jgi:hypothetical protein
MAAPLTQCYSQLTYFWLLNRAKEPRVCACQKKKTQGKNPIATGKANSQPTFSAYLILQDEAYSQGK